MLLFTVLKEGNGDALWVLAAAGRKGAVSSARGLLGASAGLVSEATLPPPPPLSTPIAPGPVLPPAAGSSPPCPTNQSTSVPQPAPRGEPAFPQEASGLLCAAAPSPHTGPPRREPPQAPQHTASQAARRQGRSSMLRAWPQLSSLTPRTGPPTQGPVKAPGLVPAPQLGARASLETTDIQQMVSLRPRQPCTQHASAPARLLLTPLASL